MYRIYFPTQDATIYSERPSLNSGLDEILEVGKTDEGRGVARSLLQFDITEISQDFFNDVIPDNAAFELVLRLAHASDLKKRQTVHVSLLNESWEEGTGTVAQSSIQDTDGTTWILRNDTENWFNTGSFYTDMSGGQLSNPVDDFRIDITTIVRNWVSGSQNYGVVAKFPTADELDTTNRGIVKFFSGDTNTVYRPTLVAKSNTQVFQTGSLLPSPETGIFLAPSTLKPVYHVGEVVRVNLAVRERVPLKTFTSKSTMYDGLKYLPRSSYFSIVDAQSGAVIIPFDDGSRVSCDSNGSYIVFDVKNMYPLRYYRVVFKVVHNGWTDIFDDGFIFKVAQ